MAINRNNYELFFLDYYEKMLQPEVVAELMIFLEENPDLKDEFESFSIVSLPEENLHFDYKDSLKKKNYQPTKNIDNFNYEEWMIGRVEGDLNHSEKEEFDLFLENNPAARLEFSYFKKVVLKPSDISFEDKESLKKAIIIPFYRKGLVYIFSTAALVLLLLGLYFGLNNKPGNIENIRPGFNIQLSQININHIQNRDINYVPQKIIPAFNYQTSLIDPSYEYIIELREPELDNLMISRNEVVINGISKSNYDKSIEPRNFFFQATTIDYALEPDDNSQSSFTSRFVSGVFSKMFKPANSNTQKKSLLEYTVNSYNMLADREVEVEKEYDSSGNIVSYNVNGELVSFTRKVNSGTKE